MRNVSLERKLNKHASTILIGGIFFCLSIIMYLTLCNMTCEDPTYKPRWHSSQQSKEFQTFLVILVFSSPANDQRRDVIRETWAHNLRKKECLLKFVVGTKAVNPKVLNALSRENLVHDDMLILHELEDSFNSLTQKLLLSIVWLDKKLDFNYMLKTDDDSLVRVDKILLELQHSKPRQNFYWGFFDGRAPNFRTGKWAETDWTLCDNYLPYALGGGYIISNDLAGFVAANHKQLKCFKNEDVSLGTWLSPLNILREHDPRFDTEYKSRGCRNSYLITHKVQTNIQMRELHNNLQTTGKLCSKEFQLRKSYKYNWNAPPSHCCIRNDTSIP